MFILQTNKLRNATQTSIWTCCGCVMSSCPYHQWPTAGRGNCRANYSCTGVCTLIAGPPVLMGRECSNGSSMDSPMVCGTVPAKCAPPSLWAVNEGQWGSWPGPACPPLVAYHLAWHRCVRQPGTSVSSEDLALCEVQTFLIWQCERHRGLCKSANTIVSGSINPIHPIENSLRKQKSCAKV